MKKKTKKEYEEYLNEEISDMPFNIVWISYCYLPIHRGYFEQYYRRRRIGTLIRKIDPILFDVGYREYVSLHKH